MPTPFGLVRAGVAPDHPSTKNVTRVYDRILQNDAVRLVGNVTLGGDITYDELKALYDVVILAFGAQVPRHLGIPGEGLFGVVDSTRFVDWYNAVPGAPDLSGEVAATTAVVIGNGNVALDIARMLAKTAEELASTDIDQAAADAIAGTVLTDIYVIGRRGPMQASFTSPELTEFGELVDAGNATRFENSLFGRIGPRESHVLANRSVEKKCILQDDPELRAVGGETNGR